MCLKSLVCDHTRPYKYTILWLNSVFTNLGIGISSAIHQFISDPKRFYSEKVTPRLEALCRVWSASVLHKYMFKNEDGFFIQQDKIVDLLNSESTGLILSRVSTANIDNKATSKKAGRI